MQLNYQDISVGRPDIGQCMHIHFRIHIKGVFTLRMEPQKMRKTVRTLAATQDSALIDSKPF
jgi:hypothetical protein